VEACPEGAVVLNETLEIDSDKCNMCGECAEACTAEAIEVIGRNFTVEDVMKEIRKDSVFYDESGGGVSFSGGEPMMQASFLLNLLKACKEEDLHTAVDTSGFAKPETLLEIGEYTDLFLYDIKSMDPSTHRKYTGVPNKMILSNLQMLSEAGLTVFIRFPLIPGVNDNRDDVEKLGEFASSLKGIEEICVLPYHRAGVEKLRRLEPSREAFIAESPDDDKLSEVRDILGRYSFKVKMGGWMKD
jgi:pyruvate formate lyase activating enzyme